MNCFLAPFDQKHRTCEGRIDRAHLIAQQVLKRNGHADLLSDPRTFVPACRRHHGIWDSYGAVVVPREAVPEALEALCREVGLVHVLDRRFGPVRERL